MKISIQELVRQVNNLPLVDITTTDNGQYWNINFVSEALAGGAIGLETGRSVRVEGYDISSLDTAVNEEAAYLIDCNENSVYLEAGTTLAQIQTTLESFFANSVYVNGDNWCHFMMPTPLAKALVKFGDGLVQEFIHANY